MIEEMRNIVSLPLWLDKIIYDDFKAIYEPRPLEVVYNPDQPYEFVRLYLGTYFPRSYAEAYIITSQILSLNGFISHYSNLEEINLLDFCCGTGGEIIGTIMSIQTYLPNIKRVNVDAFDANADAIRFLYHLIEYVNNEEDVRIEININPQGLFIQSEQEIIDIVNLTNVQYHFMMTFKAINEFVQHKTFKSNAYELIASYLIPLLAPNGIFIMSDVTTKLNDCNMFYPQMMNTGLNQFIKKYPFFKTIIPAACFSHEKSCTGCYMQDIVYVSHRHRKNSPDASKVAYRVLCNSNLATELMQGKRIKNCSATNPSADKNTPYIS